MRTLLLSVIPLLLLSAQCFSQSDDYAPEKENVIQKTKPGKQLYKEDEPCGAYFWKSEKADKSGAIALYYFYGSTEYGKGKLGLYQRTRYRAVIDESKDPPTAQITRDNAGIVKEVIIRLTQKERDACGNCFPN